MVFPQVPKDHPKDGGHSRRHMSQANTGSYIQQPMLMSPLVVSHYAQNAHTEVQLGLAPPTSGGGFFASGLFRTTQPPRQRAHSMVPVATQLNQNDMNLDEKTPSKKRSVRSYKQQYYPLSQEDTLELLLLLNQGTLIFFNLFS